MSVDLVLFLGRLLLLVGLYVFLILVVLALRRDLRARSTVPTDSAPGELVVVDPASSALQRDDAFPLSAVTSVGRAPDNTVPVADDTVSARHGRLVYQKRGWVVEDLGSTNGTFVNGRRVRSRAKVTYGDVVSFGGVSMKLVR